MEFDIRRVEEADRLSSLPDDLIHKILSCFDMKFAVQTCLLSQRWKRVWTSMPYLHISSFHFSAFRKFIKFVTDVVSHRNHEIEVFSIKLNYRGVLTQDIVKMIANYAFSHNVQQLTFVTSREHQRISYPACLFSSQSVKHISLTCNYNHVSPFDYPALTTLYLSHIVLWGDLFSKCVNLKNLTIKHFHVKYMEEVFDIISPRLSSLMLFDGCFRKVLNLIAPRLENLTINHCKIQQLNAPPGLSSFCYSYMSRMGYGYDGLLQFVNNQFHFLNKVSICLSFYKPNEAYKEEDARRIINMLQKLQSARYLTLNADTVECISSFPDLLLQHSSPFSNLICLTIDYTKKNDAFKATVSSEARTFLLENSPNATLTMEFPKVQFRR